MHEFRQSRAAWPLDLFADRVAEPPAYLYGGDPRYFLPEMGDILFNNWRALE
jgi:hypothetical protein